MRAMTEYLLKQSDLESLPKVLRRSPYESEPPMTVYYRKDVEAKAIEVSIKLRGVRYFVRYPRLLRPIPTA